MALTGSSDAQKIWNYLYSKIGNAYGVAGLMGNLYYESALKPKNLQNSYETKLGYTDDTYTAAVDDGSYSRASFKGDSAGYGLAQWTYSTRKANMYDYIITSLGKSIGDLESQLKFLYKELSESYSGVLSVLKSATDVTTASTKVLTGYEKPANQGTSVQTKRAAKGQEYYDKYASASTASSSSASSTSASSGSSSSTKKVTAADPAASFDKTIAGTYKVTASALNVRTGAGTAKKVLTTIKKDTEVKNYGYYTTKSGVKWLYIQFTQSGTVYTGFASGKYLKKS